MNVVVLENDGWATKVWDLIRESSIGNKLVDRAWKKSANVVASCHRD